MKPIVILDNGHGEETAGKRSPVWGDGSQLFEWEFNRDIVRRIAAMLKADGVSLKFWYRRKPTYHYRSVAAVQTLSMRIAATTPFCLAFTGTPEAAPGGNVIPA